MSIVFFGIAEISAAVSLIRVTGTNTVSADIPATALCSASTPGNCPACQDYDPVWTFRAAGTDAYGTHFIQAEKTQYKNRSHARLYSVALTVAPVLLSRGMSTGFTLSEQSAASLLLITTGIVAGPSGGSIYAEDWRLARRSIFIRGASAAFMVTGYVISENVEDNAAGLLLITSGALLLTGHALYDIFILSAHSVDYYNMRKRMEAGLTFDQSIPESWIIWATGAHPPLQPQSLFQPKHQHQHHPQLVLSLPRLTLRYYF